MDRYLKPEPPEYESIVLFHQPRPSVIFSNFVLYIRFEVFTAVIMKSIIFCLPPAYLLVLAEIIFFDPEDGGDMFLRNVGWNSTDYTASHPRR
jgi:hypothetical protein